MTTDGLPSESTSLRLRPLLALAAIVALALAMTRNWGFYTPVALAWALAAGSLALGACLIPDRLWTPPRGMSTAVVLVAIVGVGSKIVLRAISFGQVVPPLVDGMLLVGVLAASMGMLLMGPPRLTPALTGGVALFLTAEATTRADLFYGADAHAADLLVVWLAAGVGFLATSSLLLVPEEPGRGRVWLLGVQATLIFLSGAAVRGSAILAVPRPDIDVHAALQQAPIHLLLGHNPYASSYTPPANRPPESYDAYPFYPPLPFLFGLPFRAAGLDSRWACVLCDLLAGLVLLSVGWGGGQRLNGTMLAAIYLHFPKAPYLTEQAWYEPMLAACLGTGLLLAERRHRSGYLLLGLGLTGKQYGAVLLWPILGACRREWRRLMVGVSAAVIVVIMPFLAWGPRAFLDVVVFKHLARPVREDALAIQAGALDLLGSSLPSLALWAAAALIVGCLSWRTACGTASGLWIGTALLTFCLSHSQGFFNYYYLCEYLLLLGLAGLGSGWLCGRGLSGSSLPCTGGLR